MQQHRREGLFRRSLSGMASRWRWESDRPDAHGRVDLWRSRAVNYRWSGRLWWGSTSGLIVLRLALTLIVVAGVGISLAARTVIEEAT